MERPAPTFMALPAEVRHEILKNVAEITLPEIRPSSKPNNQSKHIFCFTALAEALTPENRGSPIRQHNEKDGLVFIGLPQTCHELRAELFALLGPAQGVYMSAVSQELVFKGDSDLGRHIPLDYIPYVSHLALDCDNFSFDEQSWLDWEGPEWSTNSLHMRTVIEALSELKEVYLHVPKHGFHHRSLFWDCEDIKDYERRMSQDQWLGDHIKMTARESYEYINFGRKRMYTIHIELQIGKLSSSCTSCGWDFDKCPVLVSGGFHENI